MLDFKDIGLESIKHKMKSISTRYEQMQLCRLYKSKPFILLN